MTRYKGTFTLSAKSYVFIKLTPPSGGTLSRVQLEEVSQSSDSPTPWEIGAKYYSSQIKQTADTIIARAGEAGLVIDGNNNHLDLIAGKVNFLTAGHTTNPKIAIDPTTGTLYAVDGVFEGTVKASNLYLNVALTAGVSDTVLIGANGATEEWIGFYYNVTISSTTFQAGEYYRVSDIDPDIFEMLKSDFNNCWSYCTGYASEVNFVNTGYTLQSAPSVRLPRAQDVDGKVITIRNCRNNYATDYAGDVYIEQIDYPGGYSGNNPFQDSMYLAGGTIHYGSHAEPRYSLDHNWVVQLRSVGTYWVVISKFRTVD
jgi:hypothetical protein